jgi:hypothetical protein
VLLLAAGCSGSGYDPTAPATTLSRALQGRTAASGGATTLAPPASRTAPRVGSGCPLSPEVRCPIPAVTRGAIIPSAVGVCLTAYNPRRNLGAAAKRRVLGLYKLPAGSPVAEWDHLVARWAGGTSTSSNVWPQTSAADKARKDRLEYQLFLAICKADPSGVPGKLWGACGGRLDLTCARQAMREFWRWW